MPFSWTNNDLIANIKRRASMPTSQGLFQNADFLALADDEMQTVIMPMMMETKGAFFVANMDHVMTTTRTYPIPSDAIGTKIKDVYVLDSNGKEIQIPKIDIREATNPIERGFVSIAYYIETNSVHIFPAAQVSTTLRIKYYKRASKLVVNNEAGKIVSINSGASTITLDNLPSTWTTASTISAVDANPPFETLTDGLIISNVSSPTLTVSSVTDLSVGDWICLDGDSPVPQITPEAIPILAQAVAVKCLEALGDPKMVVSQGKFEQLRQTFIEMNRPRADGQADVLVNRNGTLGWGKSTRGGWA